MAIVRLTAAAKAQLRLLLANNRSNTALFSVEGGGCNGLRYQLEPTDERKAARDEDIDLGDGQALRVCGRSMLYLVGTEID